MFHVSPFNRNSLDSLFQEIKEAKNLCTRCEQEQRRPNQRWGPKCHAEAQRAYRRRHPLTELQRKKDRARSYASVYLKRGKLERQPCVHCGDRAQMSTETTISP